MSSGQQGWVLLFMIGVCLVTIGWQGNLGVAFAILFCPQYVTLTA